MSKTSDLNSMFDSIVLQFLCRSVLRNVKQHYNLTQNDLGYMLGLHRGFVSRLLSGDRRFTLDVSGKLVLLLMWLTDLEHTNMSVKTEIHDALYQF